MFKWNKKNSKEDELLIINNTELFDEINTIEESDATTESSEVDYKLSEEEINNQDPNLNLNFINGEINNDEIVDNQEEINNQDPNLNLELTNDEYIDNQEESTTFEENFEESFDNIEDGSEELIGEMLEVTGEVIKEDIPLKIKEYRKFTPEKVENPEDYSLEFVLAKSPYNEIGYINEMKQYIYTQTRPIDLSVKMGFFKKRKARKFNRELEVMLDEEYYINYQKSKEVKEEFKSKYLEYVKEQNKYRESLFKL